MQKQLRFGCEVVEVLNIMRQQKERDISYLSNEALRAGYQLVEATRDLWQEVKEELITLVKRELPWESPCIVVWWYSVLMGIHKDQKLFLEMISYIRANQCAFSGNTNYFLFYQLKSLAFRYSEMETTAVQVELWKYFREIVEDFAQSTNACLDAIPPADRNQKKAIVLIEQVLGVHHGPTKTALDRCKCLMENMGMDVLLVNTGEMLSQIDDIPFFDAVVGIQMDESEQESFLEWKGVQVPFYACKGSMPERQQVNIMLNHIREMAPGHIISIGGSGMLANLVNRMIPVTVIGLCPSSLEYTSAKYQTLGRKLNADDRQVLQAVGVDEDHVIESIFTSSLKPQTGHVSRRELGIDEDAFVLVTVGMRLDEEITGEFLQMLERCMIGSMTWIIWGKFLEYESCLSKYPKVKAHTIYAGTCEDILSCIEVCDLYVNPIRKGGGTSSVEAMYKGVPVVTVNYGDVAINVGERFCVSDYDKMSEEIEHYYVDAAYYQKMRNCALQRVEILLDTVREFVRIVNEVDRREQS